jgi:hypothetical protein
MKTTYDGYASGQRKTAGSLTESKPIIGSLMNMWHYRMSWRNEWLFRRQW